MPTGFDAFISKALSLQNTNMISVLSESANDALERARKKISQTVENTKSNNKKEESSPIVPPRKGKRSKVVDPTGQKSANTMMEVKQLCLTIADENNSSLVEKQTFKPNYVKQKSYHEDDPIIWTKLREDCRKNVSSCLE